MNEPLKIENSLPSDIPDILKLYDEARAFQKIKFPDNIWPEFDLELIRGEIESKNQWKIQINNKLACIWATTFNDPLIWEEKDSDPAVYIHRIATNSEFKGNNFVTTIANWAKEFAQKHHKAYVRLDTCGYNSRLIEHYKNAGFDFLGIWPLKQTEGLPKHYHNSEVCFFEIKLK